MPDKIVPLWKVVGEVSETVFLDPPNTQYLLRQLCVLFFVSFPLLCSVCSPFDTPFGIPSGPPLLTCSAARFAGSWTVCEGGPVDAGGGRDAAAAGGGEGPTSEGLEGLVRDRACVWIGISGRAGRGWISEKCLVTFFQCEHTFIEKVSHARKGHKRGTAQTHDRFFKKRL